MRMSDMMSINSGCSYIESISSTKATCNTSMHERLEVKSPYYQMGKQIRIDNLYDFKYPDLSINSNFAQSYCNSIPYIHNSTVH